MNEFFIESILAKGYCLIDNFLPQETYLKLIEVIKNIEVNGWARKAKIGPQNMAQRNTTIRSDSIFWLEENSGIDEIQNYFAKIEELKKLLNKNFYLGLSDFEAHFAIYQPGSFYKKHVDQFANKKDRVISCVYYLNEDWHADFGGNLQLYNANDEVIEVISPQGNRFVCFESHLPHEVTTANHVRYSIATWLKKHSINPIL
ncbi:2OG-Fe(II) oxygenase [Legionella adelaidensis]|uniref:2OG-Fe(II) oxygenase n=1 Tax=Legionella adelaidensis TaxID=45056 RepID=A0A0W0R2J0_9GAMM|nr:2OG-Fe(II) oxygenase [Legionella adelaidensis]KTC65269.1 2OG-Fe(II) oxygenase [Legionella adelaidensis]